MLIYRVIHTGMMGEVISEHFFDSKNKAKKALRKKFNELKPNIAVEESSRYLNEPIFHKKQIHILGKSSKSFELIFEVWHKRSHEYEEWEKYVEHLHIDFIKVN